MDVDYIAIFLVKNYAGYGKSHGNKTLALLPHDQKKKDQEATLENGIPQQRLLSEHNEDARLSCRKYDILLKPT